SCGLAAVTDLAEQIDEEPLPRPRLLDAPQQPRQRGLADRDEDLVTRRAAVQRIVRDEAVEQPFGEALERIEIIHVKLDELAQRRHRLLAFTPSGRGELSDPTFVTGRQRWQRHEGTSVSRPRARMSEEKASSRVLGRLSDGARISRADASSSARIARASPSAPTCRRRVPWWSTTSPTTRRAMVAQASSGTTAACDGITSHPRRQSSNGAPRSCTSRCPSAP